MKNGCLTGERQLSCLNRKNGICSLVSMVVFCSSQLMPSLLTAFVKSLAQALDGFNFSILSTNLALLRRKITAEPGVEPWAAG